MKDNFHKKQAYSSFDFAFFLATKISQDLESWTPFLDLKLPI